ncbi:unnamed protein product [Parascedosporium putredinis]|uniref:Uncharacterized protein n=1 Tax=Parascedosporium putredinis TaxID=1442378 RepID=A0A9P1M8B4_9PEZI|nr:unnamed protein product [Parascedosporium putredinis]CAI7993303.1 unnamed protein product [Parascedosporium putredinis]
MNGEGAPNPRRHDAELFRVVNKSRLEDISQQLRSQIETPWALFFPTLPVLTVLCVGATIGRLALSISATWAVFDFYKSESPSTAFVRSRDAAFFLAVLGNILPAVDNPPLLVYALTGLTRSTRGWAHALLSIGLCATSIILMVTMTLLRLYIPCPTRLPKRYKPFVSADNDAASSDMVDREDSGERGPLASLFSQQRHGLRRRRYEQSAREHFLDQPQAPLQQPAKRSFILLNDGTLDLVPEETPISEVEQKTDNAVTPKPATGGFWPGPQINVLHFALAGLGLLAAAAHVGIQVWRYTTFLSSDGTVDEYFGGQWQLRVSLAYPFALIIALGPTLILYFLRISPTSHVYGKATAGDAVMLVTAGAIGLFLTGIVVTSKEIPHLYPDPLFQLRPVTWDSFLLGEAILHRTLNDCLGNLYTQFPYVLYIWQKWFRVILEGRCLRRERFGCCHEHLSRDPTRPRENSPETDARENGRVVAFS